MAFDDVRLPTHISRGAVGGPMFSTIVVATGSGAEQRQANWELARYRWDISYDYQTPEQVGGVVTFFLARHGRARGFRFKDWHDYQISTPTDLVEITATTFQIVKRYVSGSITYVRNIYKPVSGTVVIYNASNVVVGSGYTVNYVTGVVTFSADPAYVPKSTCDFDIPARFDQDELQLTHNDVLIKSVSLTIVEIKDIA